MPTDFSTIDLATLNAAQGVMVAALHDRCCQWEQDSADAAAGGNLSAAAMIQQWAFAADLLLERVWKRTLQHSGVKHRKLHSPRHTLAAGISPAEVAAIAGHRLDELLTTYAKPTGRLQLVEW